jgi:hypothetical protein
VSFVVNTAAANPGFGINHEELEESVTENRQIKKGAPGHKAAGAAWPPDS